MEESVPSDLDSHQGWYRLKQEALIQQFLHDKIHKSDLWHTEKKKIDAPLSE